MTKPLRPNPKLLALWRSLKPEQKRLFAKLAKTTAGSLRQYAEGQRPIHPDLAIRVERASTGVGAALDRTELSEVCRRCDYARIARKTLKGLA
jgi:hypothetical protein